MKRLRDRQTIVRHLIGIGSAIAWSCIYCAVASSLPSMHKLELDIQDSLIRLHQPGSPPDHLLLLKISPSEMAGYDLHNLYQLNSFYATLVKSLINNKAKIVVINLPEQMKQYINTGAEVRLERPFRETIRQYSSQIVLVSRPNTLPSGASVLNIYNNLLPKGNYPHRLAPEQILSYFRSAPNPQTLNSPARRADLFAHFSYETDPNPKMQHRVKSVATLALEKFYRATNDQQGLESTIRLQHFSPIQMNFWGPADTFPSILFQLHCASTEPCQVQFDAETVQKLRDKLVIVDLPEGRVSDDGERTPYGDMSIAEVQANLIASLMTHSFLKTATSGSATVITTLGLILMSLYIANRISKPNQSVHLLDLWCLLGLVGGYFALSLVLFWQGSMLPLSIPLLGWLGTGSSVATYLTFQQSIQQRQKLAERQAVLLQARKLLYRVATDIHDGPLQELKLVMDSLELLAIKHPSLMINPLLDRLETIGLALRNQLSNTRTIAEKLEITPELQFGLAQGIHQWLQQLIQSGELSLSVQQSLQPLREPKSDSAWIDAREDIFRFFREAIVNIIRHAQPPNGTATQVSISLSQQGTHCQLVIENNSPRSGITPQEADLKRNTGGYGTKLMSTIAAELPDGRWQRSPLEQGGMRVTLQWTLDTA